MLSYYFGAQPLWRSATLALSHCGAQSLFWRSVTILELSPFGAQPLFWRSVNILMLSRCVGAQLLGAWMISVGALALCTRRSSALSQVLAHGCSGVSGARLLLRLAAPALSRP